jgi:hypothetical protein
VDLKIGIEETQGIDDSSNQIGSNCADIDYNVAAPVVQNAHSPKINIKKKGLD